MLHQKKVDNGILPITKNIKSGHIDLACRKSLLARKIIQNGWSEDCRVGDVLLTTEAPLGETAQIKDTKVALAQRYTI